MLFTFIIIVIGGIIFKEIGKNYLLKILFENGTSTKMSNGRYPKNLYF